MWARENVGNNFQLSKSTARARFGTTQNV